MPLQKGSSKPVIASNIRELLHSFKQKGSLGTSRPPSMQAAQKQAAAIAFSQARRGK